MYENITNQELLKRVCIECKTADNNDKECEQIYLEWLRVTDNEKR